jgi:hypothetical protein
VLVDDLERLAEVTASRSPLRLLSRLDDALAADSLSGFLTGNPDAAAASEPERIPVRTVLALQPVVPSSPGLPKRVDLRVQHNAVAGWTGTVPLLLDPSSGLFAESAEARRPAG